MHSDTRARKHATSTVPLSSVQPCQAEKGKSTSHSQSTVRHVYKSNYEIKDVRAAWKAMNAHTMVRRRRAATSQVPVTFLGWDGQTGYVSVAKLRPLMCADEFKAVAVSTQLQVEFECARIEAVGLLDEVPRRMGR